MEPLWKFLVVAVLSAIYASIISALAARVRFSAPRGLALALDIVCLLPLAVPGIVAFCLPSLVGHLFGRSLELAASPERMVASEVMLALPVFYFSAIMGFRKVARETIDAARLQGLGPCGIFCRVFFPPAWPWLLGGFLVGLSRGVFLALYIKQLSFGTC